VHIERDLEDIDAAFEKMKSDITNNITEIDQQKRKFLSDISNMRKSFNRSSLMHIAQQGTS
jgi:IS1 family transposase